MAKCRSRLLMSATLVCALTASGCIVANQTDKGTGLAGGETVSGGVTGTNLSGATIRGVVTLPASHLAAGYRVSAITNAKPAVEASVTLRDYKMDQVPNAITVKTNGDGKFSLTKVPADHVWVVTANHPKGLAASLVFVAPKKVANTKMTLGSTLAVAAVLPLFVPDDRTKEAVKLDQLDMALFQKLVDAVDAVLTNDTLIPAEKTMKAYRKHFIGLRTGAVLEAYNDFVDDLRKKGAVNPNPDAVTGTDGEDETPDGEATEAEQPATGETSATDSTPVVSYDPIVGTVAEFAGVSISEEGPLQMATMKVSVLDVLVVPDGHQIHAFTDATSAPKAYTGTAMGVAFTGAKALTVNGTKAYTVALVDSKPSLVTIEPDPADPTKFKATAKTLTGEPVGAITGLVYSAEKSALLGADEGRDVIVTITETDDTTAAVAVYAGTANKTEADPAGADSVSEVLFNQPSGLAKVGSKVYVADSVKHRLVEIDLTNDSVKILNSGQLGIANGPIKDSRFQRPTGIHALQSGAMLVADRINQAIRQVDVANDKVISYTDPAKGDPTTGYQMAPYPRSVIEYKGKLFILSVTDGKVWTWTKN